MTWGTPGRSCAGSNKARRGSDRASQILADHRQGTVLGMARARKQLPPRAFMLDRFKSAIDEILKADLDRSG